MPEMTVCPVCEHQQAASDQCEVCGKRFSETTETLPDSEMEGLEPTVYPPAAIEGEGALDVERTCQESVAVEAEAMPDFEPTSPDPLAWEDRTPELLAPLCRYCRTPANPGEVICSRCGMQLPLVRPVAEDLPDDSLRRCPGCGTQTHQDVCPGCGGRMPVSSGSPLAK